MRSKKTNKMIIEGKISIAPKGYAFVEPLDKSSITKDIFIPKTKTLSAADQDLVEVEIISWKDKSKGPEGEVRRILIRSKKNVIGTVFQKEGNIYHAYVVSRNLSRTAVVETNKKLHEGDRILIEVKDWTDEFSPIVGSLAKIFGNISDPSIDIPVALEEYGIKEKFSQKALKEAKGFKELIKGSDMEDRVDLSQEKCITVDPETAKDFDDAVSCHKDDQGNYHLGVHIADVSYYVKQDSALDKEAMERGNSTYFPGKCIPMLPFELSDELCSLQEKKIRLTISVTMEFDQKGKLLDYKIFRSFIKSWKRFTYEEADEIIMQKKKSLFTPLFDTMVELCGLLKKLRIERGGLDFSLPDAIVEVDENSSPLGVKVVEYTLSHQLIEEFMLKANEIVATHLHHQGVDQIYRIHEKPSEQTLREFYDFANALGFDLPAEIEEDAVQKFFQKAKNSSFFQQLSINFIKSLKVAFYYPQKIGHYGLALEYYCHFTSPIRRYSDLITHRLLFNEQTKGTDLNEIAKICSEKERNSFRAERNVTYLKKLRLLAKLFQEDPERRYKVIINRIKPYNIYFELLDIFLEGSIHISEIHDDFYIYNQKQMSLQGQRTKRKFSYGDEIWVKIEKIDLLLFKIKWEIEQKERKKQSHTRRKKR
jgi:ribonuclease R